MSPIEKARDLITKFHQYEWDQEKGWMPDDKATEKIVCAVIDEIETCAEQWGVVSVKGYWKDVRKEVKYFFK